MSERSSIAFSLTGGGAYSRVVASRPPASPPVTKLVFILNWIHWTGGGHSHDRLIFILLGLLPHLELCLSHCHLCPPVDLLIWSIALHCISLFDLSACADCYWTRKWHIQLTCKHYDIFRPPYAAAGPPSTWLTDWMCALRSAHVLLFIIPPSSPPVFLVFLF